MPEIDTESFSELKTDKINGNNHTVEKINPLNREDFLPFAYSRNSHIIFFQNKHCDELLYGRRIESWDYDLNTYQNLYAYSFIKDNISEGARILEIGKKDDYIINHFKHQRECYRIENAESLAKNDKDLINISLIKDNHGNETKGVPEDHFDFIFSKSGFDNINTDEQGHNNILNNLNKMLKPSGYALINFSGKLIEPYVITNPFQLFTSKEIKPLTGKYTPLTKSINHSVILNDPDLFHFFNTANPNDKTSMISYNYLWRKNTPELFTITATKPNQYLKKSPAYIFHHLIKCGGTSLAQAIQNWFKIEVDRVELSGDINRFIKYKLNLLNLSSDTCIVSHFQYDGVFLHQRYPELVANKDEFKIFTFIREPLNFRASHYYYTKNDEWNTGYSLKQVISNDANLISKLIPCNENNFREILDRYFFIGIVEKMQESFDKLAELVHKKRIALPFSNRSEKDDQLSKLSPEFIAEFKKKNYLDYMIYDYCLEKFNKL
ncbi:MAG: hypothetical protein IPG78_02105 [Ignavibacteria bacterium]|nr:hypothetical protein [Ignavibacteria bacterium]